MAVFGAVVGLGEGDALCEEAEGLAMEAGLDDEIDGLEELDAALEEEELVINAVPRPSQNVPPSTRMPTITARRILVRLFIAPPLFEPPFAAEPQNALQLIIVKLNLTTISRITARRGSEARVMVSHHHFKAGLAASPAIAADMEQIMSASSFHGVISPQDAATLAQKLGVTVPELALQLVGFAQGYAVTPISNFQVGAVSVGLSGALYYGANLEVAGQALSFTVHAEQSATANAWLNGEQGLAALAISAAPCGYCRQFLYELVDASTLTVNLPNQAPQLLTYFLPDPFGPHDLGVQGGLMQPQANGLVVEAPMNPAGDAALAAANAAYSPYTFTYAGVALMTSTGAICTGRYAENAAYNPSMSPLEAALTQMVFYNQPFSSITEAVLVEAEGPASQVGATQAVLSCLTDIPLTVYTATKTGRVR